MGKKLKETILTYLVENLPITEKTIRNNISAIRQEYPTTTINAAAHILAKKYGKSVLSKLDNEDRDSLPSKIEVVEPIAKVEKRKAKKKKKTKVLIDVPSTDYFVKGHLREINLAYTHGAYTAVHILARKIVENLIREILSNQFPPNKLKANKELYYDINQKRFKDFSIILKNLYAKRHDFSPEKGKMIERLYKLALKFKDDTNDATHSWYSLIERKSEIDDLNLPAMIELIKQINS